MTRQAPGAAGSTGVSDRDGCSSRPVTEWHWALQVSALSSLAVAQPLLDLLARNAEFFVVRDSSTVEVVALVIGLVVLLPLPLVAVGASAKRIGQLLGGRLGRLFDLGVHGAILAALMALLVLLAMTRSGLLDGRPWLLTGGFSGAAFAWAYYRFTVLRRLTTYLGIALIAVPATFLLHPRIAKIAASQTNADLRVSGGRNPIVFLLFDELALTPLLGEDRRIDPTSFPNLAAFAGHATWFPNATTVSDATELAVPAILTGNLPRKGRLPILQDHPLNLFTALGGDYELWAIEPITRLCPADLNLAAAEIVAPAADWRSLLSDLWVVYRHLLLAPRYAAGLPVISDRWHSFAPPASGESSAFTQAALEALGSDRQADLQRFLAAFDPAAVASLYFLHVLLPHVPWEYLPSGKVYSTLASRIPGLDNERWHADRSFSEQAYRRYALQARYLDRWLGELMGQLRRQGLYDRSLIVLVADHGLSFRPSDSRRLLTETNAVDLVPVPLLVKAPHQTEGRVVERRVSTIDVLPTILDLLDIAPPWPMDGRSAFAESDRGDPRRVVGKYRSLELGPSFDADKFETLDWKLRTFGSATEGDEFWRSGTHPELYGRRPEAIGWRRQDSVQANLAGQILFDRYDAEGAYAPTLVTGVLEAAGSDRDCCDLAIAVNGVIRATVRAYGAPPADLQFAALVPEAALRTGSNRIEVFRIRGGGSSPVLELLTSSGGAPSALVADADGRTVAVEHDGRVVAIRPSALQGFVEELTVGGKVEIAGWAVDLEAAAAPETILVFYRDEMVYSGLTTTSRDDVNDSLGLPGSVRNAFRLELPVAGVPDLARSGLRLFALSRTAAAELGFFLRLGMAEEGEIRALEMTNGRSIPVVPGALAGFLDGIERVPGGFAVRGWAADIRRRETPERLLVFGDGELLHHGVEFVARGDVAADYEMPEILRSGFELRVTAQDVPAERLLVFAVSRRGEATLLSFP